MKYSLPDEYVLCFRLALLGEIYPAIRAIAAGVDEHKVLYVRFYLDRQPTEDDKEALAVVLVNFLAQLRISEFSKVEEECIYSEKPFRDLDHLGGFIYARREY